ncbi:acetylserotonin O-methyltransferase-like isoform X1 [Protopterus annectens]|uniref:acetylserotonin O-methyltransferase-like isoform X1 n=1 Tax=Protopterus annectens TaxID=7888 RepID=UPI001CF9FC84|nr:acetylserotonin O-methyltransferase-like isoform X1 [Protopterus annectens]
MSTSDDTEFPHKIIDYMLGFLASKALFSASELGVFDILLNSKTPLSCADIAEQACCTVDGMDKLLTACAGLKLLRRTQKNGKCLYSNTHHSQLYLGKSSPKSLYPMGKYMSSTMYLLSHYMDDSVREGKPNYDKLCEMDCKDIFGFKSIYRSEEETFKFLGFMDCIWKVCGNEVVTAFDLSQFNNICDIGGCSGAIAKLCISEYPNSRVTIFDLPETVRMAKEHFVSPAEERISFHEGNFFKDPLPEAELYILARILHDWKDDECLFLLKNLYKSCKPGGAILIIETVMNEHKSGPFQSLLFTLMMLIATAGMERTTCEYSKLLKTAGFQNIETGKTGKLYNAILARKLT